VESSCKPGNEPSGSIKCWELPNGCRTCGLSSGTQFHRVSWLVLPLSGLVRHWLYAKQVKFMDTYILIVIWMRSVFSCNDFEGGT
jgi:hypothetical protein